MELLAPMRERTGVSINFWPFVSGHRGVLYLVAALHHRSGASLKMLTMLMGGLGRP